MQKRDIIITLMIILLVVIFATQNANSIQVELWIFSFSSPLSLLIIGSIILGALISWIFMFIEIRKQKKIIAEKENSIDELKKKLTEQNPLSDIDI